MSDKIQCPFCRQEVVVDKAHNIPPRYNTYADNPKWNHFVVFHTGCERSYLRIFDTRGISLAVSNSVERSHFEKHPSEVISARAGWEASKKKAFDEASVDALVKELYAMSPEDFANNPALAAIFADVQGESGAK